MLRDHLSSDKNVSLKKPSLERLIVKNVDILSRTYAMKNSMFEVLTSYDETMHYLEIPGWLSEASDIGYQYGGFSEHLMMSLTDIFCFKDRQSGYFHKKGRIPQRIWIPLWNAIENSKFFFV